MDELIQRWHREANKFRTVAKEMFEHGDEEEGILCDVEAQRLDTCADELRAAILQRSPQASEDVPNG